MKKRIIDEDRYIINIDNKYYIVNEYTYNILDVYKENNDLDYMSKKLGINKKELKKDLNDLKKDIDNIEYYENNIDLNFPLKAQWKITNRCNLKCKHCYLGKLDNQELSEEKLLLIRDKLVNSNIMEVTITGGEALLVESLPEIVSSLVASDIKVNIFTNALLLDNFLKKVKKILKYDPTEKLDFFISVDGLEESHDNIRSKGSFKRTITNIKKAVEKGYRITTNSVLSKMNYKDIPKLYKELHDIGVYKIQISNLIDSGSASKEMKLSSSEHHSFIENLKNVLRELDNGNKLLYAEMPDEECNSEVYMFDENGKEHLQQERWKCSAGIGKCTIDYTGDVYCCPFIKNYCLGNLIKEDIDVIWQNKKRFEFLKIIAKENNNSRVCIAAKKRMSENK